MVSQILAESSAVLRGASMDLAGFSPTDVGSIGTCGVWRLG